MSIIGTAMKSYTSTVISLTHQRSNFLSNPYMNKSSLYRKKGLIYGHAAAARPWSCSSGSQRPRQEGRGEEGRGRRRQSSYLSWQPRDSPGGGRDLKTRAAVTAARYKIKGGRRGCRSGGSRHGVRERERGARGGG